MSPALAASWVSHGCRRRRHPNVLSLRLAQRDADDDEVDAPLAALAAPRWLRWGRRCDGGRRRDRGRGGRGAGARRARRRCGGGRRGGAGRPSTGSVASPVAARAVATRSRPSGAAGTRPTRAATRGPRHRRRRARLGTGGPRCRCASARGLRAPGERPGDRVSRAGRPDVRPATRCARPGASVAGAGADVRPGSVADRSGRDRSGLGTCVGRRGRSPGRRSLRQLTRRDLRLVVEHDRRPEDTDDQRHHGEPDERRGEVESSPGRLGAHR
jgi:hypothetical protein